MRFLKSIFIFLFGIALIFLFLYFSVEISGNVKASILVCFDVIIPSLFCFMCICNFLLSTSFGNMIFRPISPIFSFIFGVDKAHTPIVILSLIGGYPVGAKLISKAINDGRLSKTNGSRLILFCVNGGPAYLISSVSSTLFSNKAIGIIIFISHILASASISVITRKKREYSLINKAFNYEPISIALVNSVNTTIKAISIICGFIMLFSGISTIFIKLTAISSPIILSLIELCGGIISLSSYPIYTRILMASALTAFGGFCIHMQVFAFIKNLVSYPKFLLFRLLYTLLSVAYTYFILLIAKPSFEVGIVISKGVITGSGSIGSSILLIILSIMLLQVGKKGDIIKCKGKQKF